MSVTRRTKASIAVVGAVLLAALLLAGLLAAVQSQAPAADSAVLTPDPRYERKTAIRPSQIPGAGNGLYAVAPIRKADVIGELGGRLLAEIEDDEGYHYAASILECAWPSSGSYRFLDSRDHGGHVSRINFAPSGINGVETHLQNAALEQLCEPPYVVFVALQDIAPGEELLASYGEQYDYDPFMQLPEVQAYFCAVTQIDCSEGFTFEP
jgi:SET domain-containing protein